MNYGWGGNPWMNPNFISGMNGFGTPWMPYNGIYGYDPYGFHPYGFNPYGPMYYSPNPMIGGNTQSGGTSGASNNGRTQRGGLITNPTGNTGGSENGKRGINEVATYGTNNARSNAARSIAPNTAINSETATQETNRQGGDNRMATPASRINQNARKPAQSTKDQDNRHGQLISPYGRQQQNTKSPSEGGNINRGSVPRSQPSKQHYNQPRYSPPSNMPSNTPSPSYSPQRSGGGAGGSSGGGGSVSPTRRR